MGENITNHISDKWLLPPKYKEFIQLTSKNQTLELKNGQKIGRHFSKEDIQMANRYMKRCSTSLIIREIQFKTTVRYHLIPVRMTVIKNTTNNKFVGEDVEKREHLYTVGGNEDWCGHCGKQYGDSKK